MAFCCELQDTIDVELTQDALLDVEIGGSAGVLLQAKSVEVTANGTSVVAPDDGFDGLKSVEINTNVPKRFECGDGYFAPPASGETSISIVKQLKTLNVSCWDTSKVTYFSELFRNCISLESLDLGSWITSSLTDIKEIFRGCVNLKSLNVRGWYTKKLTSAQGAFFSCQKLKQLDLSSWDASNIINCDYMFHDCWGLRTIIGDKTMQDVESGAVALRGIKIDISVSSSNYIRFSSILALSNGLADLTGQTAQTLTISAKSYNNMYNDDDTVPSEDVIAERQARIAAICAAKNWNLAH